MLALAAALAISLTATAASAQGLPNQSTFLTFSGPVALPGITLPAGTYCFRLLDTNNRHVVQVFSGDEKTLYGTFQSIPSQRLDPPDEPLVIFRETSAKTAPAIQAWWYPGRTVGHEFIYEPRQLQLMTAADADEEYR